MLLKISETNLYSRGEDVRRLLSPLTSIDRREGPAWAPKTIGSSAFVIGTHDGSPSGSDYRGWTFSTIRPNVRAQYYELWLKSENRSREFWYLHQAYLNISKFERVANELKEFLCLHCDPHDAPDEASKSDPIKYARLLRQSYYKQHPHLHVISAEPPFPKAHLALQVGYQKEFQKSLQTLSYALGHAIRMIREEVLDAM